MKKKMCEAVVVLAKEVVMECGLLYGFSGEEAIHRLNLSGVSVSVSKKKEAVLKPQFPLPYNGECESSKCQGLRHNSGLYTQCQSSKKEGQEYCGACEVSAEKNGGTPEYGTMQQRQAVGIMEYVDPKGRKPVAYTKIMKKQKVSQEQVLEEAGKFNVVINPIHFEEGESDAKRGRPKTAKEVKEPKGAKGRPKKDAKVVHIEGDEEDLFAALVAANVPAIEEEVVLKSNKKSEEERNAEKAAKKAAEEEAKALKKQQEEEAKALKKQQDEEAKAAKKAADEAEKVAKKAAEEEAKVAKKAAEEEAKMAKKAAEEEAKAAKALKKQQEEEAKIAKKAAEEAAKAAKKQQQEEAKAAKAAKSAAKVEAKVEAKPAAKMEIEAEEEADVVKKIDFEGKKYLKSKKTGIIYDYNEYVTNQEQVVVGKWNADTNKIVFQAAAESEEEEDASSDSEEEAEEYDE